MTTPRALRRATLNGAGLALLAGLVCAAPAAAQSLNVDDTVAYINQRCRDSPSGPEYRRRVSLHDNKIALMNWRAPSPGSRPGSIGDSYSYQIDLFDLRTVDVGSGFDGAIDFTCGTLDCAARTIHYSDSSLPSVGDILATRASSSSRTQSASLTRCRESDRVLNAFKHLQQLLGGRIADPVDPFAN